MTQRPDQEGGSLVARAQSEAAALPGAVIGRFLGLDPEGRAVVALPGAGADEGMAGGAGEARGGYGAEREGGENHALAPAPVEFERVARVAAPCPDGALEAARGREVVLVFAGGDSARPIIVGWLQDPGSADPPERRYVRIDGRVLVLEGQNEVELRCGEASIVLSKDGRVLIRGKAILSEAQEMQRIRGAAVRIN